MIERITTLTPAVREAIASLGAEFYEQSKIPGKFSPEFFTDFWEKCIKSGIGCQWVYKQADKIVGTIGTLIILSPFNGETVAEETFWFVGADHRGTAGIKLFLMAEAHAKSLGCDSMKVGYLNSLGAEKLHSFYERRGFKVLQTQFVKKL